MTKAFKQCYIRSIFMIRTHLCQWYCLCLTRIIIPLCPGKQMIFFHKRGLIIYGWSVHEILWPFSWVVLMQASNVKVQSAWLLQPISLKDWDKSLFVTTMELSTKMPVTFELLWLCIWTRNCLRMRKAASILGICFLLVSCRIVEWPYSRKTK